MRILLDHCVPRKLRTLLPEHIVHTAREMGWSDVQNGRLLALAATDFELFMTVDQNMRFQQNLATLALPVMILVASDNRFPTLAMMAPLIAEGLALVQARTMVILEFGHPMQLLRGE